MDLSKKHVRHISGVLLLDKPKGISSQQAVTRVKRIYQAAKAGHTGSLDPLATGMLPICLGEATKFASYLLSARKTYQVIAKLGQITDTGDAEGEILKESAVTKSMFDKMDTTLNQFRGTIQQIPPMYSALKFQGQPLYRLARRGQQIERSAREVTIFALNRLPSDKENCLSLHVDCSKGTYIRTLVEDIGQALGCGAHVLELRRLQVHNYFLEEMVDYKRIANGEDIDRLLLPITTLVNYLPKAIISRSSELYIKQGIAVEADFSSETGEDGGDDKWQILTDTGDFLGLGERLENNKITPRRLVV